MEIVGDTTELAVQSMIDEVRRWAEELGFWNDGRSVGDDMALLHSEISEALEEFRDGRMKTVFVKPWLQGSPEYDVQRGDEEQTLMKPIGFPSEMADLLIRLCHVAAWYKIDLVKEFRTKMEYNWTRAHRHGGKAL